jgi:DNA-binding NarL/FixJ family response regulator
VSKSGRTIGSDIVGLKGVVGMNPQQQREMLADYVKLVGWKLDGPAVPEMPRRQRQVLTHLLRGESEKQIATALGVSMNTVHDYIKQLHRKLNVNSRAELLARFLPGSGTFRSVPTSDSGGEVRKG